MKYIYSTMSALFLLAGCGGTDPWTPHSPVAGPFDSPASERQAAAERNHPEDEDPEVSLREYSGDGYELSVEDAVFMAMERNTDLRINQIDPVVSGTFAQIERGVFDPELFAQYRFNEERSTEVSRATGEQFDVVGTSETVTAGVRQRLALGTDITLDVQQRRVISDRNPEQQDARVGLTVTQSLLRGFGPAVNLARVRQAELDSVASVYQLKGFTEAFVAEVETVYWNYVLAHEEIAIFERSLRIAEEQVNDVEERIEVGTLAPTEAAAARTELARRREALIDARSRLENNRLRLARLINPDSRDRLDVPITTTSSASIDVYSIDNSSERIALAWQSRPDLREAQLQMDRNNLDVLVTRNGMLPQVDLFFRAAKTGFDDRFFASFEELTGNSYNYTLGADLGYFPGNRQARARNLAARANRLQAELAVRNLQQLIQMDVLLAINEVERARQQIAARKETRQLAEQTAEAERDRFQAGTSTALLVAQAQRDLLAAQIGEVEAVVAYRIALIDLYHAEGSLLERRGVVIEYPGI